MAVCSDCGHPHGGNHPSTDCGAGPQKDLKERFGEKFDSSAPVPGDIIAAALNARMTPEELRIQELENCLRESRRLTSIAAVKGFDEESCRNIFQHNGVISRLVPPTAAEREEMTKIVSEC